MTSNFILETEKKDQGNGQWKGRGILQGPLESALNAWVHVL